MSSQAGCALAAPHNEHVVRYFIVMFEQTLLEHWYDAMRIEFRQRIPSVAFPPFHTTAQ